MIGLWLPCGTAAGLGHHEKTIWFTTLKYLFSGLLSSLAIADLKCNFFLEDIPSTPFSELVMQGTLK